MVRCLANLLILMLVAAAAPVQADGSLVIPGTGDSQELLQELARAFEASHPGAKIEIPESIGSSGGIKNLIAGNALLARTARPLKESERQAGLDYLPFAYSPIVFAAHLEKPCVENLSSDQVVGIFSGAIRNWNQLGTCPDHVIYVANREPGDSSRSAINAHLPAFAAIAEPAGETVYSTPKTVGVLQRHPYTIAYAPLAALTDFSLRVLALDGQAPTVVNVQNGSYPLVIPLGLVWKGQLPAVARPFVEFLFSPEGQRLIRSKGLIPAKVGKGHQTAGE
ncbi:phosphate ABC transporter substrate-binding protein [Desulfuromonas sp. DDH964]|uniref:PstS family phosphate ABC transporter substrate-binding protein n=1 Tax=Desulfuromonas sp. DDH964 TaxID=1823759 RepID=UPI00078D04A6|nr:substrate-binding domain-containing protein [Desulfuromonas sp. DDH964]AMV73811.1 phosphate ABC transporter substrate-binding protein [Desulfuromonas sp. DDH964]